MEFLFTTLFTDPTFRYFLIAFSIIAFTVWVLTLITDNHSWMDKLWPLLPIFYSLGFLYTSIQNRKDSVRLKLMTLFITCWGLRLAYIFYRRGYYKLNFEDHRWEMVKKRFNYPQKKFAFHVFNFLFMAILQNVILLGYTLPLWFIQNIEQDQFNYLDIIFSATFVIFYIIEAIADEQQWSFQSKKHDWLNNKTGSKYSQEQIEDFKRGFLCKGLFKYSRHPNYFGDIFLWWSIYAFSISSQLSRLSFMNLFNYSMFSALLMCYLFKRSVAVTENVSRKKYAEYSNYQSKIGCIIPSIKPYISNKIN